MPTTANIAAGQVNVASAINNYWQITGTQLEIGPVATSFEFEPYETTLRKCQRYYWRVGLNNAYEPLGGVGNTTSTTNAYVQVQHPQIMRVSPTSVDINNTAISIFGASPVAVSSASIPAVNNGPRASIIQLTGTGFPAANTLVFWVANNSPGGYIGFSAEL